MVKNMQKIIDKYIKPNMDFVGIGGLFIGLATMLELMGVHTSWIVILACLCAGAGALLSKRQKWYGQLFFITGNILFMTHFINIGFYGNVAMFMFFNIMCLWTIYEWRRKDKKGKTVLRPSQLGRRGLICLGLGLLVVLIIASFGGIVQMLDFGMLYLGIVGKILLVYKKIDGWKSLITCDAFALVLFAITGQWFLLVRHGLAVIINGGALRLWATELKNNKPLYNKGVDSYS
ncbi:MAG: nicotinamide mononucleotide transporter family protein [Alphaproteobacteria bacterium]|nr:nicotinamide mononucleotide transporter family protein [Alphaproteobacteria bacterium]